MKTGKIAAGLIVVAMPLFGGCANDAVVVPYDDGHFESTAEGSTRQDAMRDAVAKAKEECASRHRSFVASDSYSKWTGTGDEDTHRTISAAGEILSDAGVKEVPDVDTDHDYKATVAFRCK